MVPLNAYLGNLCSPRWYLRRCSNARRSAAVPPDITVIVNVGDDMAARRPTFDTVIYTCSA